MSKIFFRHAFQKNVKKCQKFFFDMPSKKMLKNVKKFFSTCLPKKC
jgi:hypothetical protein